MKLRPAGKRHPLLLYQRTMDRLWQGTLLLGLLLGGLWWQISYGFIPLIETNYSAWLLAGSVVTLGYTLFALLARRMAYIQTRSNHLLVVTPFIRLKIAYRRIRSVHASNFSALFPPDETSWARRRFLAPFFGHTVIVIDLTGYPLNPLLLRLFLARQMFVPGSTGLVLLIPDWMALSLEMDSALASWRETQAPRHPAQFTHRR